MIRNEIIKDWQGFDARMMRAKKNNMEGRAKYNVKRAVNDFLKKSFFVHRVDVNIEFLLQKVLPQKLHFEQKA